MSKAHGGKRTNSGKTSGWGYPKGTPLRLIKLPVQIADAVQAAKERMTGDDLIRLLNQDLNKLLSQENKQHADDLKELPNQNEVVTMPAIEVPTPHRRNNKSGYPGVSRHKQSGKWQAQIRLNGKPKHLGLFDTPEAAYEAQKARSANHDG